MRWMAAPRIGSRRPSRARARSYSAGVMVQWWNCRIASGSSDGHDPEADTVRVRVGRHLVPVCAPEHGRIVVHPGAASDDAQTARPWSGGVADIAAAVVFGAVPIRDPFPRVADHVVQPVRI